MKYKQLLRRNIKKLRNQQKLTQDKFGERIGLTVEAIRNIEQGKSTPTAKTIDRICDAFDINAVELLLDEPSPDKAQLIRLLHNKLSIFSTEELLRLNDIADILHKNYKNLNI